MEMMVVVMVVMVWQRGRFFRAKVVMYLVFVQLLVLPWLCRLLLVVVVVMPERIELHFLRVSIRPLVFQGLRQRVPFCLLFLLLR